AKGQLALFVTERAVFRIGADGLELIEIAPGLDAERDVIAQMGFRPRVAPDLRVMDARIFAAGTMKLAAHVNGKPHRYRSARIAQWYEARKAAMP
ncbi:MAG TPA: 3-oxoacid CoA-transferase, partial [Casimicrobiaceae bacterium]